MLDYKARLDAIRGLNPAPMLQREKLNIRDVKKGGYLELNNQTWKVVNVFLYLDVKWANFSRRNKDYWVTELELFSLETGESTFVEWEIDDQLEICQTEKLVKMKDISFNGKALSHSDLEFIAEEEEGEVTVDGVTYIYIDEDSWAGLFFKARGEKEGIPFRSYEFESEDNKYLSVEAWHEDVNDDKPEREAFISHSIKPAEISILQAK